MTVLSKRFRLWLFWIAIVFGAVGLSFAVDSIVLSFSVYSLLLVFAVSYLMARASADSVEVTRRLDRDEAHIGERVHAVLTVSNKRPWPVPWVFVDEHVPERIPIEGTKSKVMFLLPGQEMTFDYQAVFNRRGYHRFGPAIIETGDLFGLHRKYRTSRTANYVTVLPDVLPIGKYEIGARRPIGPVRFAHRIFEDPTRIAGVREYRPGDSLARIHWKASARTGVLYSKVYEPSTVIGATVVLDFHETGYRRDNGTVSDDKGDMAVTVAASIATFIAENGEQIGLFTNGRDAAEIARWDKVTGEMKTRAEATREVDSRDISWRLRPVNIRAVRSIDQARTIVETLARLTYTDGLSLADSLARFHGMIVRNSALLVVTTRVTPELALVLFEMKRVGFAVTVFIIMDPSAYGTAQGLLLPQNIDVIHIKSEESLREVATGNVYC